MYDSHDCADLLETTEQHLLGLAPYPGGKIPRANAGGFGRHPSRALTAGWETWPHVKSCDWGFVFVTEGAFGGQFAYYDDQDSDDDDEGEGAIIYLAQPMVGDCYGVPLRWLRKPPFDAPIKPF